MSRNPEIPHAGPLVVKIGGDAIDAPEFGALCDALAAMHRAAPGGLVLVHGGGKAVDRQLDRLGLRSERRDGLRITPPEIMDQITSVLAGLTNTAVVGSLTARGIPAVGLTLGDGLLSVCAPIRPGFDAGRVGDIQSGDSALLRTLLGSGFLPVVACIGIDADGRTLNVNADHAARGVARIARASGLLLLTDAPGVLGADAKPVSTLDAPGIEALIARGVLTGGMIPKARAAAEAAEFIGAAAIIATWKDPGSLPALCGGAPVGTRIVPLRQAESATFAAHETRLANTQ